MENTENKNGNRENFMQGWGFILLVIIIVIGGLIGLKAIMNWYSQLHAVFMPASLAICDFGFLKQVINLNLKTHEQISTILLSDSGAVWDK